jgi:2-dehydropantoate 2-reductase
VTIEWHILGAGAIGTLLACKLQRAGIPVRLLYRPGGRSDSRVTLRETDTCSTLDLPRACVDELPDHSIGGLFITTKSNQATAGFASVASGLRSGAPVILLHNGMGVYEQLGQRYGRELLYCGTTTEGAYFDEHNILTHAGRGDTRIGQPGNPQMPDWFTVFAHSAERFLWEPDIQRSLWRKLVINCAINPLTAIHHCRNGELLERAELRAELETLCLELVAVTRARGDGDLAGRLQAEAFAVIRSTANNQSSMLQDVLRGRATEIDFITGYLVDEAGRLNVPVPHNRQLLQRVRQLDTSRGDP